jgi:hypothetical protein
MIYESSVVGPEQAQARARTDLVFGLSSQSRPLAHPPGQARPAKARARSVKPEPALNRPDPALTCGATRNTILICLHKQA